MTNQLLSSTWISRLEGFSKLIVGFSGGLDSTVLLQVLASQSSLKEKILAVHVNHGISEHAKQWQNHCQEYCFQLGVDFITENVSFDRSSNIEEGARTARYQVFTSLLTTQDCLVLGHHLNDQAETVLLQLFRGAGVDGLAAMTELSEIASGSLSRPFLAYSREQLEHYAQLNKLTWVEDESNTDIAYSRNYLRQEIIPSLMSKWPGVVSNLARTAAHCQQAKTNLDDLALIDGKDAFATPNILSIEPIKNLSIERLTNVIRFWLKNNQVRLPSTQTFQRIIHEVIWASSDAMPLVAWDDIQVRRYQNRLYLDRKSSIIDELLGIEWLEFPKPLKLPHTNLCAKQQKQGLLIPPGAKIEVRFRQGGEELRLHGQTKKLKTLFQEWGVQPWLRENIPLIYINGQFAAVVGYAVSDIFYGTDQEDIWEISDHYQSRAFVHGIIDS